MNIILRVSWLIQNNFFETCIQIIINELEKVTQTREFNQYFERQTLVKENS